MFFRLLTLHASCGKKILIYFKQVVSFIKKSTEKLALLSDNNYLNKMFKKAKTK